MGKYGRAGIVGYSATAMEAVRLIGAAGLLIMYVIRPIWAEMVWAMDNCLRQPHREL